MAPAFFVSGEMYAENVKGDEGFREFFCLELWEVPGYGSGRISGDVRPDGYPGGIQNKKFIPAACAQWGGIRHTGLFSAATKGGCGEPDAGIPAFLRLFRAALRMSWPVPWADPAFIAFRPGKEAGHEDEVQEDARGPEGELLL